MCPSLTGIPGPSGRELTNLINVSNTKAQITQVFDGPGRPEQCADKVGRPRGPK
jgi:hypothetical protein